MPTGHVADLYQDQRRRGISVDTRLCQSPPDADSAFGRSRV